MIDEDKLDKVLDGMPFTMTEGQLTFLRSFISGKGSAYLMGGAGDGKSACMLVLARYYENEILFCATSGTASVQMPDNIGAGTSHKVLSLLTELSDDKNMKKVQPVTQGLLGKTDLIKVVVVDEAFCWDSELLYQALARKTRYDKASRNRKRRNIRFLLVGDPLQRLPICKEERRKELNERYGHWLMFKSRLWKEMRFTGHVLTENKRQNTATKEDRFFKQALQVMRYCDKTRIPKLLNWLNKRVVPNYSRDGMYLAPTNKLVNDYNENYLKRFADRNQMTYTAVISGKFDLKECPVEYEVTLAEGCDVITLVNHPEGLYQNGSNFTIDQVVADGIWATETGKDTSIFIEVKEFENNESYVETETDEDTGEKRHVQKKRTLGTLWMLPCKLSAGFTIARCQGRTFSKAGVIDVGTDWCYDNQDMPDFMIAGLFVAASRFKSINDITFARPLKAKHIRVCRDSINFWFETLEKQNDIQN